MEAVRRVLREEPVTDRPDAVGDTGRFVEDQHHAIPVVNPCVGVGVLLRPQPPLDGPVARAFLQVALDQFRDPLRGHDACGGDLKPVAVDGHRQPLGYLGPGHRP